MARSELGTAVAELRARRGWTQEQLAEAAGVHPNTVRDLERLPAPNPRLATLVAIARTLGVAVSEILTPSTASGLPATVADGPIAAPEPVASPVPATGIADQGAIDSDGGASTATQPTAMPADAGLCLEEAKVHRSLGEHETALRYLTAVARSEHGDSTDYHNSAILAEELGAISLARRLYERALRLAPEDPTTLLAYADYLSLRGGDTAAADDLFERLTEALPNDPEALSVHFDHLARHGRAEEAKERLERLKELALTDTTLAATRLYLVDLCSKREHLGIPDNVFSDALARLTDWVHQVSRARSRAQRRQRARLFAAAASYQSALSRLDRAARDYIRAIQESSDNPELLDPGALRSLAAYLSIYRDLPDLAVTVLRGALAMRPADERTWKQLIIALADQGHVARNRLRQLQDVDPGVRRLDVLADLVGAMPPAFHAVLEEVADELAAELDEPMPRSPLWKRDNNLYPFPGGRDTSTSIEAKRSPA